MGLRVHLNGVRADVLPHVALSFGFGVDGLRFTVTRYALHVRVKWLGQHVLRVPLYLDSVRADVHPLVGFRVQR